MPLDRNDPEVKALIEEVTAEATEALSAKNKELIAELRTAKAKAKGSEIDPEEHARLQTQVEELTGKLEKATKDSARQIEKLTKDLTEKEGALTQHLIDGGLSTALAKAGVAPHFMDAVKAMLRSQTSIKDGAAVIGDKLLDDHVMEWASTDQGKHFITAPANTGGGGQGGNGGGKCTGNMGGSREDRVAALKAKFPELSG
ncbi:hypothetical protein [Bordetella bronchiseptica]|uniref:Phage protein n=2 Tax=Bordetella bronchiseptica TaxID=518 RepID=A0A0H3LVM2_BORBR|nr:hypothetical protein [Bordetella bronchiseptica]KCV36317.1 hypothetical protein L489_3897 [Bordetella bronchiseptica 00-P-2730]KDD63378.1 hypothetical protein L533_3743 [Bordetella bronchiseptica OSU553]SHT43291.1 Uncharacterised protein [Mycobacteroides abscessus subsp. abscessus]AMG88515.1 hypothetical protein AL472_12635 [Bordetella bronchiseptica]AMG89606.1 hypothetical protein AL472_19060 [Bordetella bronchiseptica]